MQEDKFIQFLEDYAVPDQVFKAAYDKSSNKQRAKVKTAVALQESYFGSTPISSELTKQDCLFKMTCQKNSYENVLVLIDPSFNSPAKLIAVLMPAILAQVRDIHVIFLESHQDNLLNCLELMGIENVYLLSHSGYEKNIALASHELPIILLTEQGANIKHNWTSYNKQSILSQSFDENLDYTFFFPDLNLDFFHKTKLQLVYLGTLHAE